MAQRSKWMGRIVAFAGWLITPERLIALMVFFGTGVWGSVSGLPAPMALAAALVAVAATLAATHFGLLLLGHLKHSPSTSPASQSHGILIEDSKDVSVEDNDIHGTDIGIASYCSPGGAMRRNQVRAEGSSMSGDHVTSYNQSGGITAHTVHVAESAPNLNLSWLAKNEKHGDHFATSLMIELTQGRPTYLGAAVKADHIHWISVRQFVPKGSVGSSMLQVAEGVMNDGRPWKTCEHPNLGRYVVEVLTTEEESVEIEPLCE